MTIEKILEIRDELVNQGIINKPKIDDSVFLKLFEELKEWFKWDIQRFPYWDLNNKVGEFYSYKEYDLKLYNKNYDLIVFSLMLGICICEKKEVLNNIEETNEKLFLTFTSFSPLKERSFYKNYQKICGINIYNLGFFIRGMIRNKMGNGTFEEFLNNYATILQKYKPVPLIDKNGTNETTATPVDESVVTSQPQVTPVAPTYQLNYNSDPYAKTRAKFGFVPLAHVALQYNPVGCWFYDNQLGIYRSQFVDYHKLDNCHDQKAVKLYIEHITRVMSMPKVYQMILQEMPELGTDINGNTIKFKIAGYNATKIGLLAVKDDEHVLAVIYDAAEDKAHGISGDKKNVDAWTAKKLAD